MLTTAVVAAPRESHPPQFEKPLEIYLAVVEDRLLFGDTPAITSGSSGSDFGIDTSSGGPRPAPARASKTHHTGTSINHTLLLFFADVLPPSHRVDDPRVFSLLYPSCPHSPVNTTRPVHTFPYNHRSRSSAPSFVLSTPLSSSSRPPLFLLLTRPNHPDNLITHFTDHVRKTPSNTLVRL